MTSCRQCRSRTLRAFGLCHTCYTAMRRAAIEAGTWETTLVPADRARAHVKRLRDEGYAIRFIAYLARVDEQSVSRALSGKHGVVTVETEERICGVPVRSLWTLWHTEDYPHRMPSGPIVRRLRALAADGWTYAEIGEPLNWSRSQIWRYVSRPPEWSMSTLTRRVDEMYHSPAFSVPVRQASAEIARHKWPRPLDWDDIDNVRASQEAHRRAAYRYVKLC